MPSGPLVFINYSDPARDRKQKSHRHVVTKYATLHACRTRRRPHTSLQASQSPPPADEDELELEDDSASQELVKVERSADGVERSASELRTLLSFFTTDPFDTLPVKPDHGIWRLLTSWLNAGNPNDAAEDGYRMQVAVIRRSWFWPMVNRNKATFTAAVAWIATSTGEAEMEPTMISSLGASLPALRESLHNPEESTAESAWYSIILLLAISFRIKDTAATLAHYRGLAALLSKRPDFFTSRSHGDIPFTASFLYTFVASVILRNYDDYIKNPSLSYMPPYILSSGPRYAAAASSRGESSGFVQLHAEGAIGEFLADLIVHIIPMQDLAAKARRNRLTPDDAADLLNCIWCCQLGLYIPKPITTEIEELVWIGIVSYWHVERSSWQATSDLSIALYQRLLEANTDVLQQHYPSTLFWLAMTGGPLLLLQKREPTSPTAVAAAESLQMYVVALSRVLGLTTWPDARRALGQFLWSEVIDDQARDFWESGDALYRASSLVDLISLRNIAPGDAAAVFPDLPCQFCRQATCACASGRASLDSCPSHLRGSLWAIPPSVFSMFCGPIYVPHRSEELPKSHIDVARREGGF